MKRVIKKVVIATKQSPRGDCFAPASASPKQSLAMTVFLSFMLIFCGECLAAQSAQITGYTYQHNFIAGETIRFTVTIKNTGDAIAAPAYMYAQVILTNSVTGAETYPAGATATTSLASGAMFTSETSWTSVAGKYTVTLVVYGSTNGITESELTRVYGAYPIRVGATATTETLKTFPTMFDFGILPYGRHMHPIPLEITYDFFLFNVLRDQKPWYLRIYTDNATRYKGIRDAVYVGSHAGLVSSDGRYTITIKTWCLNNPPEDQDLGWDATLSGPPPVDDDTYWKGPILDNGKRLENKAAWLRIPDYSEMTADRGTWRNLIGQDFYDTQYVTDVNRTGNFTLKSPFSVYLATETNPTSVKGNYSCNLIVEIYSP